MVHHDVKDGNSHKWALLRGNAIGVDMANLEQLRSSLHSNLEEVRPSFIHLFIRLKKTKCESENVKKVKK